jgi:hypothetical protein
MPLFSCADCGTSRTCDWLAGDDWPDGVLRGVGPDCPECECPMTLVSDEDNSDACILRLRRRRPSDRIHP